MDHKLHLTDRVDARTGQISVDARGCLTQENYPALLRNLCGAARIVGGGMLVLDISRATHLDPDVLLALRRLEIPLRTSPRVPIICPARTGSPSPWWNRGNCRSA